MEVSIIMPPGGEGKFLIKNISLRVLKKKKVELGQITTHSLVWLEI